MLRDKDRLDELSYPKLEGKYPKELLSALRELLDTNSGLFCVHVSLPLET